MEGNIENINSLVTQLRQMAPDFINNCCIINGNVWALEQVEKMRLDEYATRSLYSLPLKFYKYFPDTEKEEVGENGCSKKTNYSVLALESNEVYLNSPSDFDDAFDSEINVPFDEFEAFRLKTYAHWCKCCIPADVSVEELANILLSRLHNIVQSGKDIGCAFDMKEYGETARLRAENFTLSLKVELRKYDPGVALKNTIINEYNRFIGELKNIFRICCFTTASMSQLMWGGSYANEHKGFCLEYTVLLNEEYEEILNNIRPVIYSKIRRPVTQAILDAYDKNWNVSALRDLYLNGALRKSIDWAYQNEWRLLLPPQIYSQQGFTYKFFPITKVYLGNRMSAERRRTLIDICKEKGVPYAGVTRSPDLYEMQECKTLCENCLHMAE